MSFSQEMHTGAGWVRRLVYVGQELLPTAWQTKRHRSLRQVDAVLALESEMQSASDEELRRRNRSLRYRFRAGEKDKILPEALALLREASSRTLDVRHRTTEIWAGIVMANGGIAELAPGEGRTLALGFSAYFFSLAGTGVHVVSRDDRDVQRQFNQLQALFQFCGVSAGVVTAPSKPAERRTAYSCDITFVSPRELGFDFLHERLRARRVAQLGKHSTETGEVDENDRRATRDPCVAFVDEIDCVLLDEFGTPLTIGATDGEIDRQHEAYLRWAAVHAPRFFEDEDYDREPESSGCDLTRRGRELVRKLGKGEGMGSLDFVTLYKTVERAIAVRHQYMRDRDYLVRDGKIVYLDRESGRLEEGRRWLGGIQQALEAREGIEITTETAHAARITVHTYFSQYRLLGGISCAVAGDSAELRRLYGLDVSAIPSASVGLRKQLTTRTFATRDAKTAALIEEVESVHEQGRPVLIGTASAPSASQLTQLLLAAGITARVIGGRQRKEDDAILAHSGQPGSVTILAGTSGRGESISLEAAVADRGGLHVIVAEPHASARMDRRLIAQCACHGQAGSFREYRSLDDDVLVDAWGPERVSRLRARPPKSEAALNSLDRLFRRAQRRVGRDRAANRAALVRFDDRQKKMYSRAGRDPYID
jgi:preprotein translocase subunit SecA